MQSNELSHALKNKPHLLFFYFTGGCAQVYLLGAVVRQTACCVFLYNLYRLYKCDIT